MRISDWSSDVCSSDLRHHRELPRRARGESPACAASRDHPRVPGARPAASRRNQKRKSAVSGKSVSYVLISRIAPSFTKTKKQTQILTPGQYDLIYRDTEVSIRPRICDSA